MNAQEITPGHVDALRQLCKGVVWDGDLISKGVRDELFNKGFVTRIDGWNVITPQGVQLAEKLRILRK